MVTKSIKLVKNKIIIITQARIGSSRFPGKVLKRLGDSTLLGIHIQRLKNSKKANRIIIAAANEPRAGEIKDIAEEEGVDFIIGSTEDVLDRYYQVATTYNPDYVVRVTSDCPLIDSRLIDEIIEMVELNNLDYGSNTLIELFPDGQDIEVFRYSTLKKAWKKSNLPSEREHVTPFIKKNCDFNKGDLFKAKNYYSERNYNNVRMTVDEPIDLDAITRITKNLGTDKDWLTYTNFIIENYKEFKNQGIIRNEGYLKSLKSD